MATREEGGIFNDNNIWSKSEPSNRSDPVFTENDGWGITYSQLGGNPVVRKLVNRNFFKHAALAYDVNRFGSGLPWASAVSYEKAAVVLGSDDVPYVAGVINTDINPVSDITGATWKHAIPEIASDGINIVSTTDARGDKTLNLSSNLSQKANSTLDNVTVGNFLSRFENSTSVVWSASGTKIKATSTIDDSNKANKNLDNVAAINLENKFIDTQSIVWGVVGEKVTAQHNYPATSSYINTDYSLLQNDIGKNIYFQNTALATSSQIIVLPSVSQISNGWFCDISISNASIFKTVLRPFAGESAIRNGVSSTRDVVFPQGTMNTHLRLSKIPNSQAIDISGASISNFSEVVNFPIQGGGTQISRGYSFQSGFLTQWVKVHVVQPNVGVTKNTPVYFAAPFASSSAFTVLATPVNAVAVQYPVPLPITCAAEIVNNQQCILKTYFVGGSDIHVLAIGLAGVI